MRGTSRTGKSVSRAWGFLSRNPTNMPVLCSKACSALVVGPSFFLSSCPYKISQQSHKSAPTYGWMSSLKSIIAPPQFSLPPIGFVGTGVLWCGVGPLVGVRGSQLCGRTCPYRHNDFSPHQSVAQNLVLFPKFQAQESDSMSPLYVLYFL